MRNIGEACTAANRFYVHEAKAEDFTKWLTARLATLEVGNGLEEDIDVGPLVNADTRNKATRSPLSLKRRLPKERSSVSAENCLMVKDSSILLLFSSTFPAPPIACARKSLGLWPLFRPLSMRWMSSRAQTTLNMVWLPMSLPAF